MLSSSFPGFFTSFRNVFSLLCDMILLRNFSENEIFRVFNNKWRRILRKWSTVDKDMKSQKWSSSSEPKLEVPIKKEWRDLPNKFSIFSAILYRMEADFYNKKNPASVSGDYCEIQCAILAFCNSHWNQQTNRSEENLFIVVWHAMKYLRNFSIVIRRLWADWIYLSRTCFSSSLILIMTFLFSQSKWNVEWKSFFY